MYKVLLADNEQIFVNGFEEVLNNLPDYAIAAIAQNVDDLVGVCKRVKPDLVITRTFFFYKQTAFNAVAALKKVSPNTKVIMMLDTSKYAHVEMAYDVGVDACIERAASPLDFMYVIEKTMASEPVALSIPDGNAWGPYRARLTLIEKDVVLCLCQNLSSSQIADQLDIDTDTVEAHINNILQKTKHKNILGLIFEAVHKGYEVSWRAELG